MPVSTEDAGVIRIGNGVAVAFDFGFKVNAAEDVKVSYIVGEALLPIDVSEFSVGLNAENLGGTVTFGLAIADAAEIYIYRETPITQLVEVSGQTKYDPRVVENVWDKLTLIAQELKAEVERSVKTVPGEDPAVLIAELLQAVVDAGDAATAAEAAAVSAAASALAAALFDPSSYLAKLDNLSGLGNTTTAQTNLGGTAVGRALFTAADAAAGRTAINAQLLATILTALTTLGPTFVAGDIIQATGPNAIARFPKGAAGKLLGYDAGGLVLLDGAVKNYQAFTASGTWTKPTGLDPNSMVWIEGWAAGGAGSRDGTNAGGGGGGQYKRAAYRAGDLPSTMTVTVGVGAVQGGGPGGNTTIAGRFTCAGGATHTSGSATAAQGGNNTVFADYGLMGLFVNEPGGDGSVNGAVPPQVSYSGGGGRGAGNGTPGGISLYGGDGGTGGDGSPAPGDGIAPGGGGGGILAGSGAGADGARGEVRIWCV